MEPGIYFDMPEADYHAVPALGSSGIKDLLVSPLTFWTNSPFNELREDADTEGKRTGSALHKRLLEGPEAFACEYAIKPDIADYPDALDGGSALKARCGELGLSKSGTIAELCERIREADPDAVLWPDIMSKFEDEADGKTIISPKVAMEIERHARIIEVHDDVVNAFRGGYPEVSMFWTDAHGILCKLRVDYLKVRFAVDLKSFSNPFGMAVDDAVGKAMANYKYHSQGVHYLTGIEAVKELYREHGNAIVHATEVPQEWLDAFAAPGSHRFSFVFLETGSVPNVVIRELADRERKGGERNAYWLAAEMHIERAKAIYRTCMDHYGPDMPWVDPQPMRAFTDTDFPLWALS